MGAFDKIKSGLLGMDELLICSSWIRWHISRCCGADILSRRLRASGIPPSFSWMCIGAAGSIPIL